MNRDLGPGEFLFTSESVTEGHPDKIADQISDGVLDEVLRLDPAAHVACEVLITTGLVVVAGEISTEAYVDIPRVARETVRDIGYTDASFGFDYATCGVVVALDEQSSDILRGVHSSYEQQHERGVAEVDAQGAGDQGMMFGYASDETPELMPLPLMLAHRITRRLAQARKQGPLGYLRPDGKAQVTVRYRSERRQLRARAGRAAAGFHPARPRHRHRPDQGRRDRARAAPRAPCGAVSGGALRGARLRARESDRPVRHRRADG